MLTARELQMAGMTVTLIDRRRTGRESSWAGGGIISPLYPWRYDPAVTALAGWGQARYQGLCETLATDTGVDPQWIPSGLLILAPDEEPEAEAWAAANGIPIDLIDRQEMRELEPALQSPSDRGIWLPRVAQVRNPRLVRSLRRDLEQRGITLIEGQEVVGIRRDNRRVEGVVTNGGPIHGDRVIISAGAWSARLLSELGIGLEVEPVLGQMILFKTPPGTFSHITLCRDRYLIPRQDGRVLFGSTLEHKGFLKQITRSAREELHRIACGLFPALRDFPIEHHWAGLRPGSPAGIPTIGPIAGSEGLFINAGHFRNGVVLAPASCRLLADLVLSRPAILPAEPYALTARRR